MLGLVHKRIGASLARRRSPTLNHVTVEVAATRVHDCVAFYEKALGLTPIESKVRNATWFAEGVHLYWGMRDKPYSGPIAAGHFALEVGDNYHAIVERCEHRGLFIAHGSVYWGSPRCYVRDPDGNRIELMEYGP